MNILGDLFATMVLISAILNVASPYIRSAIMLYALQSWGLALFTLTVALSGDAPHLYLSVAITALVKGILFPYFLLQTVDRIHVKRELQMSIGIPLAILSSGALTVLARIVTDKLIVNTLLLQSHIFPLSLATFLVGGMLIITRKQLLSQIISLLIMENAIFLAANSVAQGMPLVVELGVLFDIFVAILITSLLILQMGQGYQDIETSREVSE